jgi:hypothetical protein
MKIALRFAVVLLAWSWLLAVARAASPGPDIADAILTIQQAPDPSAVVAAYANGAALNQRADHNFSARLDVAYVTRMVELGLPELAYHQAQSLARLEPQNGPAWAVLAYVGARRGDLMEAISDAITAGRDAPDNPFVEQTAGEILAWYDQRADPPFFSDATKDGLEQTRRRLQQRAAFIAAYDAARNAYQAQAASRPAESSPQETPSSPSPTLPPASAEPESSVDQIAPLGYGSANVPTAPPPPPADYPAIGSPNTFLGRLAGRVHAAPAFRPAPSLTLSLPPPSTPAPAKAAGEMGSSATHAPTQVPESHLIAPPESESPTPAAAPLPAVSPEAGPMAAPAEGFHGGVAPRGGHR